MNKKLEQMKNPEKPKSQIQEILYCLITRINIDRKSMMLASDVYNLPNQLMRLKNRYGIKLVKHQIKAFNKYGETITQTKWSLLEKKEARAIYNKMLAKEPIPKPKIKFTRCTKIC